MQELRHNTGQVVRVGVIFHRRNKVNDPLIPAAGIQLDQFICRYLIKAGGQVVDIVDRPWSDIPQCMGCYNLNLSSINCNKLGSLVLYLFNGVPTEFPIWMEFNVINQNVYDAKYGNALLKVETEPQGS